MPNRFFCNLILFLAAAFSFQKVSAQSTDGAASRQTYPVTAQAFIVAQPNQRLSSYFSSSTALSVNLLLKDLTKNSIQVYLRWSMEGPGVRVSSMDGYIPANLITLDRGMIRRFSGLDLQHDYFRQDLIEEQGLGNSPLRTNLPEGFYTFRVQALEAGTGREVSNIGETYFSITTPLPPIINIPFNGAELTTAGVPGTEPQRVNIQWMPRHYRMPGNITTYDLKVCKVPDGYEPTEALDACVNPVIDDKGNPGTFYPGNTGIGNSLIGALERGARYAARVTVHEFDTDGNEVVFVNEGRSEVNWFRYGKECVSPESFVIAETGPGRLQLSWEAVAAASAADINSYKVLYRKAGDSQWTTQVVTGTNTGLSDLKAGGPSPEKIEIAVQAECTDIFPGNAQVYTINSTVIPEPSSGPLNPLQIVVSTAAGGTPSILIDGLHSVLDSIKIPCASQISTFDNCEASLPKVLPTGTKELTILNPGDVLSIYDMAVIVTSVLSDNGLSGKGLARLPFAQNVLTPVEFSGVKAYAGEAGTKGGCVYQVASSGGYFRMRSVSGSALGQEQIAAVKALNGDVGADSSGSKKGFTGTIEEALEAIDSLHLVIAGGQGTADTEKLLDDLRQTVVEATQAWTQQVNTRYPAGTPGRAAADSIVTALSRFSNDIRTGTASGGAAPGGTLSVEQVYKDIIYDFNHPVPPTGITGGNVTLLNGITIADLGACLNQVTGYDPLSTAGERGLTCLGNLNGAPYWTYTDPAGNTIYITGQPAADGTINYFSATETDWRVCGRSPVELCAGLWHPVSIEPGTPDSPNPLVAAISNVIPDPVGSTTATISWAGHSSFARYVVTYVGPGGAELQQEIRNTTGSSTGKLTLNNLLEASSYTFTIDAYGADGAPLSSYKNGAFSTVTEKLAMPENLRTNITNSSTIVLTWDKNVTHESYELVYTDAKGEKHNIPATTNSITISGLDSTVTYPFTLVAKGKSATGKILVSDPASGTLTTKAAEPCSQPLVVTASVSADAKGFRLAWVSIPGQTGVEIRYRKVQNPEALWTTATVTGVNEFSVKYLITRSQYEYKVKAICSKGTATEEAGGFVTLSKDKIRPTVAYQCGKSKLPPSNNKTPLDVPLEVGDYILIGDFPAQIDRLETGSAPYRGLAHVLVPYLGMSNFLMEFTGLAVNTDYEVLAGEMHSVTDPVALSSIKEQNAERIREQIAAVKQIVTEAKELIKEIGGLFASGQPVSKEKYDAYVQKQNEIVAELNNTDPELAAEIKAKQDELMAIYMKPEYLTAGTNDYKPTLSAEDQAQAAGIAGELGGLNEEAEIATIASLPPLPLSVEVGGSTPVISYQTLMSCADGSTVGQHSGKSDCSSCKGSGLCYYGPYYPNSSYEYWYSSTDKKWIARSLFVDEKFVYFEKDAQGDWHEYAFEPEGLPRPFAEVMQSYTGFSVIADAIENTVVYGSVAVGTGGLSLELQAVALAFTEEALVEKQGMSVAGVAEKTIRNYLVGKAGEVVIGAMVKAYPLLKNRLGELLRKKGKDIEVELPKWRPEVGGRFIAKTGIELRAFLTKLTNKPVGKSYNGDLIRSLSKSSEINFGALPDQMTDHYIYSSWGRYDLPGAENAMYLSKTVAGNQTELVPHYGVWNDFSTYKYVNIQVDNLLDLTDDAIRLQLGTEFQQLTKVLDDKADMYEFTNELAEWARQNGYNGLIVPGARGAQNYENVIVFEQSYINQILQGKTAIQIPK